MERFTIIYAKLAEAVGSDVGASADVSREELDEIAELRRVVLEVTEPDQVCYTGT